MVPRRTALTVALAVTSAVAVASCQSAPDVHVAVTPSSALYDTPFTTTTVTGLPAGKPVTLNLTSVAKDGTTWTSSAVFAASETGQASVAIVLKVVSI